MNTYLTSQKVETATDMFDDMFSDLPPLDPFDIKKEEIAAHLSALLSHSNISRTELAEKLGWKKSRVTVALSGKSNLTIKTIFEMAYCLKFDVDVIFRGFQESRTHQPWQNIYSKCQRSDFIHNVAVKKPQTLSIKIQTAKEIENDLAAGVSSTLYLSVVEPKNQLAAKLISNVNQKMTIPMENSKIAKFWNFETNSAY